MSRVSELSRTLWGRSVVVILFIGGGYLGFNAIRNSVTPATGVLEANSRYFVDADNMQSFRYTLSPGEAIPVPSPFSGKRTGYPAELCYWTKDGQIKSDPTPVLLKNYLNPDVYQPTFCPDCGRLVVPHNPYPAPGSKPPPTLAEWQAAHPNAPE